MEKNQKLTEGFTIIICSYNGASKITPTLEHLDRLQIHKNIPVEIIFIDNNSSDNTMETALKTWGLLDNKTIQFRAFEEKRSGKYYAIQKAINAAQYTYFIFCDDDNWLAPDYVEKAYAILKDRPDIGALGGYAEAVFENEKIELPIWFTQNIQMFAISNQGANGDVTHRKHLWGAGLVSKTALYRNFYNNHPSFLLSEDNTSGLLVAEDTEYCIRLILKGYKLYYDDSLKIKHFVPTQRLSFAYFELLKSRVEGSLNIILPYNVSSKLYGSLATSKFNILRLKLLAPIRVLFSTKLNRIRHRTLYNLFYAPVTDANLLSNRIRNFVEDKRI